MSEENTPQPYLAAAIQMHSTEDKAANVRLATSLVEQAAGEGASLVVLPEYFNCLGRLHAMVEAAEPVPGPTSDAMSQLAARLGITLLAGSLCEQTEQRDKAYNTSLLFAPTGEQLAKYRKLHLFDVDVEGQVSFQESKQITPGEKIVTARTPLGCLGLSTCYDLRFPELYRALADRGMKICVVPSAFTAPTGRVHWDVLLRARAIENQVYVVAANQYGCHAPSQTTYGHSAIYDPWGERLAEVSEDADAVLIAQIDPAHQADIRRQLPSLKNRRKLEDL